MIPGPKPVKIYPPPPSTRKVCKDPVAKVTESQLAEIDPKGERKALCDYRRNPRSVKPGDVVRVTFKNGDPFNGVVLSIKLRGIDTSFLLRNELTRVAVEMSVKVFSPNVQSVEIVQRAERKPRRARLYYMRFVYPGLFSTFSWTPVLIDLLATGPANTIAAVSRMLWLLISARRGLSWAAADGGRARNWRNLFCISKDVLLPVYIKFIIHDTASSKILDLPSAPLFDHAPPAGGAFKSSRESPATTKMSNPWHSLTGVKYMHAFR